MRGALSTSPERIIWIMDFRTTNTTSSTDAYITWERSLGGRWSNVICDPVVTTEERLFDPERIRKIEEEIKAMRAEINELKEYIKPIPENVFKDFVDGIAGEIT